MPDDDNVDVRLLLPHAGGLRVEGGQWGERWGRSCVYGEAVRGKKRQRQHSPHHSTASPDRGAWPWLSSSAHAGTDPARPRRRLARLFLATTFSVQLSARYHDFIICLPGDPQLPRLRHRYLEGALPLWKKKTTQPSDGSAPLPSRSFQTLFHFQTLHFVGTLGGAMGARPLWVSSPLG